jgi:hypothetical protein
MRQQFTGLSGVACADGCGYHLSVQSDACDEGGQALGDFSDQHPSIYCPQKSALKGAAM